MARRELGPAALKVCAGVAAALPDDDVTVGCSGGADSLALALAAHRETTRRGTSAHALIVDHGLQAGSADVAAGVVAKLAGLGVSAEVVRVQVEPGADGIEAAARDARLAALAAPGRPVLLGHTLDDQAESVLLGLLRGSGARSLAGMAPVRGQFRRPLLGLRRADTEAACRDWGVDWWSDPMNQDQRFARVRARSALAELGATLRRDLAPSLARTATLARADADLLDELAAAALDATTPTLRIDDLANLPEPLRWRAIHAWLTRHAIPADQAATFAVDKLVTNWHGQGPIALPGARVMRRHGELIVDGPSRDTSRPAPPQTAG